MQNFSSFLQIVRCFYTDSFTLTHCFLHIDAWLRDAAFPKLNPLILTFLHCCSNVTVVNIINVLKQQKEVMNLAEKMKL